MSRDIWVIERKAGHEWFFYTAKETKDDAKTTAKLLARLRNQSYKWRVVRYTPAETEKP